MRKNRKLKKKRWLEKRAIKIKNKWYYKKKKYHVNTCLDLEEGEKLNRDHAYLARLPEIFSFVKNPKETISFLNKLVRRIEKKMLGQKFFIDASGVQEVTVDALIYIIAVIYNIKANRALKYSFEGNLPMAKAAREVFERSGYLNYFKMKRLKMPDCSKYVQIVSGRNVENSVAAKICDFVNEKYGSDRQFTKILYSTLIELMSNTAKHAYNEYCKMARYWYLYAIYDNNKINIAFIDTGEGIPNTVKKKFIEKINPTVEDSSLIYAALTESGRSETGLSYRGRGLPQICKHVMDKEMKDFFVISGSGSCRYNEETQNLERITYNESIFGTIFRFSIWMEGEKC
ncbi:MAG: hypothetical protein UFJ18_11180 [Blautia sp.]|nr:hypothetical protein [Blautia sp.]